jgi:hypothetical protein
LSHADSLASFNLQAIQALKAKSNPNQVIQNNNQLMEEEDLSVSNLFFLQSANNTNPKQQKQPKASYSRCNCRSSSSITQQKILQTFRFKHPTLKTNPPPTYELFKMIKQPKVK